MEAMTITWTTTTDELHLIAKLLQQKLNYYEVKYRSISGHMDYNQESEDYRILTHMYNQIIQKLC